MSRELVEARLKKSKRIPLPSARQLWFTVCCGIPTCGAVLGRIWRFTAPKAADWDDSENWDGGPGRYTNGLLIGTSAMVDLAADWSKAHFGETEDGTRFQVWIAEHERGYCRLPNGDYQVLRRRDANRETNRVRHIPNPLTGGVFFERREGRRKLPTDMAEMIHDFANAEVGSPLGLGQDGRDQVGEFPVLPAVIICPECGEPPVKQERCRRVSKGATRNRVWPLAFDERNGTWYTVCIG